MILAVDIGNTSISFGIFKNDCLAYKFKLSSDKSKSADEYASSVREFFRNAGYDIADIEGAVLLSVVPSLQLAIVKALSSFGITPVILGAGVKTGLNLRVEAPSQLGTDIVAEAVGALSEENAPLAVIDFGTATAITVIDEKNELSALAIAAGLKLSADALSSSCALLNEVFLNKPQSLLGKNTCDSINSGLVWGSAFMIDGFINRIREEYGFGDRLSVVATGGLSELIVPLCENKIKEEPDLTLKGLYRIYRLNKK